VSPGSGTVDGAKPLSCDRTVYLDKVALRLHAQKQDARDSSSIRPAHQALLRERPPLTNTSH
jgi:hypothetical protein